MENYEPIGVKFYDKNAGEMLFVLDEEPRESIRRWIMRRGPEGQWVTWRKATDEDIAHLEKAGHILTL